MKYFKKIIFAFLIVVSIITLTACKDKNTIVGSWEHTGGYVYTFNDDMTGSYTAGGNKMEFTYKDDGEKVSILYTDNTAASDYAYRIEGNKLIIKDSFGNDVEYIKK